MCQRSGIKKRRETRALSLFPSCFALNENKYQVLFRFHNIYYFFSYLRLKLFTLFLLQYRKTDKSTYKIFFNILILTIVLVEWKQKESHFESLSLSRHADLYS